MENGQLTAAFPRFQAERQIADGILNRCKLRLHACARIDQERNAQRSGLCQLIYHVNHLGALKRRQFLQRAVAEYFFHLFINRLLNRLNHGFAGHHLHRLGQLRRADNPAEPASGFGDISDLPAAKLPNRPIVYYADDINGDSLLPGMRRGHHRTFPHI
ncbi:hypothetical protein D3C73_1298910 [compost metagenome]